MAERNAVGRPTVMTPLLVSKLEEAFAYGCSDSEACFYAGISKQTLYDYQKKHPEFIDRKEGLKERPILLARQKVVKELSTDVKNAQWYLERKSPDFRPRADVAVSGDIVGDILKAGGLLEGENDTKDDGNSEGASQSSS